MTVNEIRKDISENLGTLTPRQISDYAVMLSVHLGSMSEGVARAEVTYNKKWETLRIACETDGMAERKSKASEEYYQKRLLELEFKAVCELIKSLKKRLSILEKENESMW